MARKLALSDMKVASGTDERLVVEKGDGNEMAEARDMMLAKT